jgi:dTDP-4-dehydrorhamnose reductase
MKTVLILGLNSYVGFYTARRLSRNHRILGVARRDMSCLSSVKTMIGDSLDMGTVSDILSTEKVDFVVNCVSEGNLDKCEEDRDLCERTNFTHVANLVDLAGKHPFKLVHFSSNAVYDGTHPPYSENDAKTAVNMYGDAKARADDHIKARLEDALLIRIMTLYGPKMSFHRHNPATMIIEALNKGRSLRLVDDVYGNLLYISDLVEVIEHLIGIGASGEFNVSGDDNVNRYELGRILCGLMGKPIESISPCSSDEFKTLAPRALNTTFDNSRIKAAGLSFTDIVTGLRMTIENMKHEADQG